MKRYIVLATIVASLALAHGAKAGGSSSSANCWAADGNEACAATATIGSNTCNLDPAGAEKPKVKKVASGGRTATKESTGNNCRYRCPDQSTSYPANYQGTEPSGGTC